MKKFVDKGRRPLEFQVGDKVLLKLTPQIWRKFRSESVHRVLILKYDGPFEVVKSVGDVAYKLKLPERLQIHPTVHVSFLKPYHGDGQNPTRNEARRAPPIVMVQFDREVNRILDKKVTGYRKGGNMITYYLVKWKLAVEKEASWEKASTLWQFEKEVKAFENTLPTRMLASFGGGGLLGALCVADDGIRNEGAWAALSRSCGFMFSQHTHGFSCLTSDALKDSLRGTYPVSLVELANCGFSTTVLVTNLARIMPKNMAPV